MDDLFVALGALVWWKHDSDKAAERAAVEQRRAEVKIAKAKNPDAPRAWKAIASEFKDE